MKAKNKHNSMTTRAYDRKITGTGLTYKEHQVMKVPCEWCLKIVQQRSLKQHHLSASCILIKNK